MLLTLVLQSYSTKYLPNNTLNGITKTTQDNNKCGLFNCIKTLKLH